MHSVLSLQIGFVDSSVCGHAFAVVDVLTVADSVVLPHAKSMNSTVCRCSALYIYHDVQSVSCHTAIGTAFTGFVVVFVFLIPNHHQIPGPNTASSKAHGRSEGVRK